MSGTIQMTESEMSCDGGYHLIQVTMQLANANINTNTNIYGFKCKYKYTHKQEYFYACLSMINHRILIHGDNG